MLAAAALPADVGSGLDAMLDELALGPRSSHERGRGARTLRAYAQWIGRSGGDAERPSRATPGGRPSGASRGSSNGSPCPA